MKKISVGEEIFCKKRGVFVEKYISYYKLMEELAEEEGKKYKGRHGLDEEAFKSYRNSKKRHFENILKQTGWYEKCYCQEKKEYQIPIGEKEAIKHQLRQETKPLLKKVKNRLKAKLTVDHIVDMDHIKEEFRPVLKKKLQQTDGRMLEDIISRVVEVIRQSNISEVIWRTQEQEDNAKKELTKSIIDVIEYRVKNPITYKDVAELIEPIVYSGVTRCSEKKKQELHNIMCTSYQIHTRAATEYVIDEMKGLMERDIGHMMESEIHHNRKTAFIKDEDASWLVYWYLKMMSDQSERWNKLFDIVATLRMEEFCQHVETGKLEMSESQQMIERAYAVLLKEDQEIPIEFNKFEKIPREKREKVLQCIKDVSDILKDEKIEL